jgi:hypothetical protein
MEERSTVAKSSTKTWWPSATTSRPELTTKDHIGGTSRQSCQFEEVVVGSGGEAGRAQVDRDQVGYRPHGYVTCLGPPDRGMARGGGRGQKLVGRPVATGATYQALVVLEAAHFHEGVEQGVAVRAQADGRAGQGEPSCRADPVTEILFGGRAHTGTGPRTSEQDLVVGGQMGGVYRGGAGP